MSIGIYALQAGLMALYWLLAGVVLRAIWDLIGGR